MSMPPLQHIVRVRTGTDYEYVHPGLMDEILINANQLENSLQKATACLWKTTIPFAVDPVLWRFQVPAWWQDSEGETKKNYTQLGQEYTKGTQVRLASGPLLDVVPTDADWVRIAANIVEYEQRRLLDVPAQMTTFDEETPRVLQPVRVVAPALVANSEREDRINRLLVDASRDAAAGPLAAQVIVPPERLFDPEEVRRVLDATPTDGISSYFVWTPKISEQFMLADSGVFESVLGLISSLAERGIPVVHQYGNYAIAALHDFGLMATTHHLGWVDHGEPAEQLKFAIRSCRTYVPAVRHSILFGRAASVGRSLERDEYADRYCACPFCLGVFDAGQHPLDLLLEDEERVDKKGRRRRTPTSRAVSANIWHYLWSRQLEVVDFSRAPAVEVVRRDLERAALLLGSTESQGLERLAEGLQGA
jgi:hypothetical protein